MHLDGRTLLACITTTTAAYPLETISNKVLRRELMGTRTVRKIKPTRKKYLPTRRFPEKTIVSDALCKDEIFAQG